MSDDLSASLFDKYVGTTFTATSPDGGAVPLTLVEVTAWPEQPHAPRTDPFSLLFTGPPDRAFPQSVVTLTHPEIGPWDLLLVPRQPVADGLARYEVMVN